MSSSHINWERMRELHTFVSEVRKQNPDSFDMNQWLTVKEQNLTREDRNVHFHGCGTVGCLAGYACLLFDNDLLWEEGNDEILPFRFGWEDQSAAEAACELLGLTYDEGQTLFLELNAEFDPGLDEYDDPLEDDDSMFEEYVLEYLDDCINAKKMLNPNDYYEGWQEQIQAHYHIEEKREALRDD